MVRALKDLHRLAEEFAALTPAEQAKVIEEAKRRQEVPDWGKQVQKISVSAEGIRQITKMIRHPAKPNRKLRRLMSDGSR